MPRPTSDKLRPLTGAVVRRRFSVVDIETKDGNTQSKGFTRPFLAGRFDGTRYYSVSGEHCISTMLSTLLTEDNDGTVFYAHFGGSFDWLHFLPYIALSGYWYELITVGSTISMMKVKRTKEDHSKGWTFLDSGKLLPMKLAKAAKSFGTAVQKLEFDLDTEEHDPRWDEYLEADCRSLYQVLERFHDLVEGQLNGEVGITAASTAMKTFRRGFQRAPIERNIEHHAFTREAYYGGRVEIFTPELAGLHVYDINSCYPHAMLEPMPVGKAETWVGEPPKAYQQGHVGFATARVYVPENTYVPVLPVRDAETGRLTFPAGKLKGTWDVVELERARELGAEVTYEKSVWFEARPVLREMIETLYKYRNKGLPGYDEGLDIISKILMNSLYGRFAMKTERENIVILRPGEKIPNGARIANPNDPDCRVCYVKTTIDNDGIIPQIAAHVTAIGRVNLHKFLLPATQLGVLAYCDTDSIHTTADLSSLCGHGLGSIKDEGAGVTYRGTYLQPKLYLLEGSDGVDKLAMKGYREKSKDEFDKVRRGEEVSFQVLSKLGQMAKGSFRDPPTMRTISRQLQSEDRKRTYLPNGTTKPLVLEMW